MPVPLRSADHRLTVPDAVVALSWAPDSSRAVIAGAAGQLWIVSQDGRLLESLPGHADGTFRVGWQPGGSLIASVGQDGHARFWAPEGGSAPPAFKTGSGWVEELSWSPSGEWLAIGAGKTIHLWHRERGWVHTIAGHPSTVSGFAWRADSKVLAAAAYGGVRLYDIATAHPLGELPWKTSMVSLAWSPDSKWVVAGTQELAIQVWPYPFKTGEELAMSGYAAKVRELAWHFSGRYLATGGGNEAMVWDCGGKGPAGSTPRILEGHTGRITALAYQNKGHVLASGGLDSSLLFWNAGKSSAAIRQIRLNSAITALAASPNDQWLLAGCHNGDLALARFPV
jgi:WD40 repeat protein